MGLFCSLKGVEDVLGITDVCNIVQRGECFLASVDLSESKCASSPATRSLEKEIFLTEDSIIENVHSYAFSAKVQTHNLDTPTYKDILRLPEEERNLWDNFMVKELKCLRDLGSFKMVSRRRGANVLASTWAFTKKRYTDELLNKFKARFFVR